MGRSEITAQIIQEILSLTISKPPQHRLYQLSELHQVERLADRRDVRDVEQDHPADSRRVPEIYTLREARAPVVSDGDHAVDTRVVEDRDHVVGHLAEPIQLRVVGFGCPAVTEEVGGDDTIAVRDEVGGDQVGPEGGGVGPSMLEEEGWFRVLGGREVVGVG